VDRLTSIACVMPEAFASPWRKHFVQTLGLWAACCILAMMLLDGGVGAGAYSIGSGIFWIASAAGSFLHPKPSPAVILAYRIGPLLALIAALLVSSLMA
jgi:hypothetical protein